MWWVLSLAFANQENKIQKEHPRASVPKQPCLGEMIVTSMLASTEPKTPKSIDNDRSIVNRMHGSVRAERLSVQHFAQRLATQKGLVKDSLEASSDRIWMSLACLRGCV